MRRVVRVDAPGTEWKLRAFTFFDDKIADDAMFSPDILEETNGLAGAFLRRRDIFPKIFPGDTNTVVIQDRG